MIGTLASRAFFTWFAIFGTDATHDGRGSQMVFVMSSTRSAAPFTGISTATGAGIAGIGDVGVGAGVAATVGAGDAVGDGAAAGCVHAARITEIESATNLRMAHPPAERANGMTKSPSLPGASRGCDATTPSAVASRLRDSTGRRRSRAMRVAPPRSRAGGSDEQGLGRRGPGP